jgi:ribosomal protein L7/L12
MRDNETERIARLERRVDYLIRYLGIDEAHIAGGVLPAGRPAGLPTGGGLPPSLDVAPADELANTTLEPVYDAIRRGKKIEAVKLYRQLTHARLGEAKHAVDSMARDL